MGDLLGNDTDYEMDKYYEADETISGVDNTAIFKNKKSVFNTETLRHEILLPMSQGGYVQIGEEGGGKEIVPQSILIQGMEFGPDTPEFQAYYPAPQPEVMETAPDAPVLQVNPLVEGAMSFAQERQASTGAMPTMEDFEAAGYASDVVESAGLMGPQSDPTFVPAEALSENEIAQIVSEGGSLIGDYDPLLRESGSAAVTDFSVEAAVEGLRAELEAKGADSRTIEEEIKAAMPRFRSEAGVLSNALFGTGNALGVGIGDFATAGVMDIQEGYRMYQQNFGPDGSLAGRAMGMTIMLAGLAEATGVGYAFGKLLKAGVKRLEGPLMSAAAQAEQRIAQEGSTMFSNPVGPIVDRGLSAAGRLVAPDVPDAADLVTRVESARLAYDANPNDTALRKEYFDLRKERDANPIAEIQAPTENKSGIIAFSGSGKDFEKFSIDYINTGEGAQAYGNGLYFSSAESIANFYQKAVRQAQNLREGYDVSYKGTPLNNFGDTAEAEAQGLEYDAINNIIGNLNKVTTIETRELSQPELIQLAKDNFIKERKRHRARYVEDISARDGSDSENWEELSKLVVESFDTEINVVKGIDVNDVSFSEGKTYQVGLDVTQNELLDYDKSFKEQTPFVQTAILKALEEITIDDAVNFGTETVAEAQKLILDNFTTVRFLNDFSAVRGSNDAGEKLLDKHGVKGIKYKANRGSGNIPEDGPDNYVIFDDRTIQILKKYGIVGPVALSALTAKGGKEEGTENGI